jgi:hypothetical protein
MSVKGESSSSSSPIVGALHKDVKIEHPASYGGERSKLKGFLVQVDLYLSFYSTRFNSDTERVLYVVTLLKGEALNWIEGFVVDYMKHANPKGQCTTAMQQGTIEIFGTYKGFVKRIKATFGEIDEERQAERAVQTLRQRGSAATYTAEFQRHAIKTGWNDDALRAQYYRGLKDAVKDELIKEEKPDTLEDMISTAVKIDNRLYERALEKKGFYETGHRQRSKQQTPWPQPMELDATGRGELSPQERQRRSQDRLCFSCGKPGHMARNCKTGGKVRRNVGRRGELNATTRKDYTAVLCNSTPLYEDPP